MNLSKCFINLDLWYILDKLCCSVLLSILLFKTCRPMSNSTGGTENPSVRPKSHVKSASLTQSQVARVTDLPPLNDGDNFRPT